MKKLTTILAVALAAAPFYADIYSSNRFVEFGANVAAEEGQNVYGLTDFFVKDFVIDLPKIYSEMGDAGFCLNLGENAAVFTNVNINGYGAGIQVSESLNASVNISKEFFKLLAEGNDLNTQVDTSMAVNLESFVNVSVPIYFRINKFKITATPSYFVPILYLPNPDAKLTYITNTNGKVTANAHSDFTLYSLLDLSPAVTTKVVDGKTETSFDFSSLGSPQEIGLQLLENSKGCGGIDLGIQVEFPWNEKLDFGAYANVPIFHGLLKNTLSGSADFSIEMDGFLDHYTSENSAGDAYQMDYKFSDLETESVQFYVNRPFRAGIELAFRPFGNWFTLHPRVGVAMRNPFGKDFDISSVYPEYKVSADFSLFNVLGASICTQYTDKVFIHTLGLNLNARVLELNLLVGTSGGDFLKSFNLSGLKASVGVSLGF